MPLPNDLTAFNSMLNPKDSPAGKKTGCTHVYRPRVNITIRDIHNHRVLQNYLKRIWLDSGIQTTISPESNRILRSLPNLAFVPALIQVWTLCRFNELKQISISDIKSNKSFEIQSSKSAHRRIIPSFPCGSPLQRKRLSNQTLIIAVSYDSFKDSIKKAKNIINLSYVKGILDCTHIFRHLEATWLHKEGLPLEQISYRLGHLNNETTKKYIHSNKEL